MRKRLVSTLLTLCMVLALLPVPVSGASVRAVGPTLTIGETAQLESAAGRTSYPPVGAVDRTYVWFLENVEGSKKASEVLSISYDNSPYCRVRALGPGQARVACKVSMAYTYNAFYDSLTHQMVSFPAYEEDFGGSWIVTVRGEPCTVTFDRLDGSAPAVQSAFAGEAVSEPEGVARPGFVLDGWFTDAAFTRRYDFSAPLTGNLTLYARWLVARTVTLQSMGKTVDVQTVADGETLSPPSVSAPRGYAFDVWCSDAACTRPYSFSSPVTSDLILYAKLRQLDPVTVSFDCADGSEPVRVTGYAGETLSPPYPPSREGCVFKGWYTDAGCSESSLYSFGEPLSRPLTLYAGWQEPVRVSFDSRGGSAVHAQELLTGELAERPEDPKREGYTFGGWYADAALTRSYNFSEPLAGDLTLYAGWTQNEYTVTFTYKTLNGWYVDEERVWQTQTVKYGDTADEPSPPSHGFDFFTGWSSNGSIYDFSLPVTGDLELVTEWVPSTFMEQGGGVRSGVEWKLDTDGILSLAGEGDTGNYQSYYPGPYYPPWNDLRENIRSIELGRGVDVVGEYAFSGCYNAASVSLPYGLTSILTGGFQYCSSLLEIELPSSLETISYSAFSNCDSLRSVEIPKSITDLSGSVFSGCVSLKSVSLPEGLKSIGNRTFESCGSLGGLELTLPDSLTSLGSYALSGSGLRSIRIPGGVRELSDHAFAGCSFLESVELADGVEVIGEFAFDLCPRLRTIVIPKSVRRIGQWGFAISYVQEGPVHIFYAGSREDWKAIDINSYNDLEDAVIHYNCSGAGTLETVSFDSRGGTAVEEQLCLPGEFLEEPQAPERTGYTFTGWYKDAACTSQWSFAVDKAAGKTTLYAGWSPNSYSVYFSGVGSRTVAYGQQVEEPEAPAREGAKFNGWYTDEDARTRYLFRGLVAEDLTLYPGWLEEPAQPETPAAPSVPDSGTAYPSTQIVDLNGKEVEFQMYALKDENGNDTNHIKIRDLALALNGTKATFSIGWANGVSAITTGAAYEPNGTENKTPFSGQRSYTKSATAFILNGTAIDLEGIVLTDDSGGGYTYCQVKDLAAKLNFTARWDSGRGIICIETE